MVLIEIMQFVKHKNGSRHIFFQSERYRAICVQRTLCQVVIFCLDLNDAGVDCDEDDSKYYENNPLTIE